MKVEYKPIHPDDAIVEDEMGCNTNMSRDKDCWESNVYVRENDVAAIIRTNDDKHFTVLGIITLSAKPVHANSERSRRDTNHVGVVCLKIVA